MNNFHKWLDLSGQIFGRLTVTDTSERRDRHSPHWLCNCSCGSTVWVMAQNLKAGITKSCGCFIDDSKRMVRQPGAKVDGKQSREYRSWHGMKQRCTNPNETRYERYGGRGISVCPEWLDDFSQFLKDMGKCPPGLTLERKNNNGNYCRDNCKWATNAEQNRNKSSNRLYTFNNVTLCRADWVKKTGINSSTLRRRLDLWPVDRALTEPVESQIHFPRRPIQSEK